MTTMQKVNVLLAERDITFAKLAEAINVSRQSVMNWHRGYKNPSAENIQKIAGFLNIDVMLLVDDDTELSFVSPLTEKEQLIVQMYRLMSADDQSEFAAYGMKLAHNN